MMIITIQLVSVMNVDLNYTFEHYICKKVTVEFDSWFIQFNNSVCCVWNRYGSKIGGPSFVVTRRWRWPSVVEEEEVEVVVAAHAHHRPYLCTIVSPQTRGPHPYLLLALPKQPLPPRVLPVFHFLPPRHPVCTPATDTHAARST